MRTRNSRFALLASTVLVALTTACSEAPVTAPQAVDLPFQSRGNLVTSTTMSGDTTITLMIVDARSTAAIPLGNFAKIQFPNGSGSICDLATSSYGERTWDSACTPSATPVTMTAKSWINAQGEVEVDFQPAMRFVPTLKNKVTLSLKASSPLVRIDFRAGNGSLVNEALTDASVKTNVNTSTSWATRVVKHFSGYTVVAD